MSNYINYLQISFSKFINFIEIILILGNQPYNAKWLFGSQLRKKIKDDQLIAFLNSYDISKAQKLITYIGLGNISNFSTAQEQHPATNFFSAMQDTELEDTQLTYYIAENLDQLDSNISKISVGHTLQANSSLISETVNLSDPLIISTHKKVLTSYNYFLKNRMKISVKSHVIAGQPKIISEIPSYSDSISKNSRELLNPHIQEMRIIPTNTQAITTSLNLNEKISMVSVLSSIEENGDKDYEPIMGHKEAPYLAINLKQKEKIMKKQQSKELIISEILNLIGEGEERIKDEVDKAILLFGRTGAGKSTLTYHMAQKPLQAIIDDSTGNRVVDAVEQLKDINISHKAESETKIPGRQDIKGVTIWDLPGFNDTSITQEIANAFYIRRVCENTKHLKFVLTMSEAAITQDRGSNAVEIITQFAKVFTDLNALEHCVSLVITQVPSHKTAIHLKNNLEKLKVENPLFRDNEDAKKVVDFLMKSIHIFHAPQAEGLIPNSDLLEKIEDTTIYLESKSDLINIAIGTDSMPYVKELLTTSEANLIKIGMIITSAIKEASESTQEGKKNIFTRSYELVKDCLPHSLSLEENQHNHTVKALGYFSQMDHLNKLSDSLPEQYTPQNIKQVITTVFEIFKEFASSKALKEQIHEYLSVFQQQLEYVKFLNGICKEEIVGAHNKLCETMKDCKKSLQDQMKMYLCTLELQDNTDPDYYTKAIKYLDLYKGEPACIKIKAQCYDHLGDISHACSKKSEALKNYSIALKLDKTLTDTYDKVGEILFNDHNYSEALKYFKAEKNPIKVGECFKKLIEENPTDPQFRVEKGDYYLSVGIVDKAIKCYQEASSLSKDLKFKSSMLKKQEDIMKNQLKLYDELANKLSIEAENSNFHNFDEVSDKDLTALESYNLQVLGDTNQTYDSAY